MSTAARSKSPEWSAEWTSGTYSSLSFSVHINTSTRAQPSHQPANQVFVCAFPGTFACIQLHREPPARTSDITRCIRHIPAHTLIRPAFTCAVQACTSTIYCRTCRSKRKETQEPERFACPDVHPPQLGPITDSERRRSVLIHPVLGFLPEFSLLCD